MKTLILSSRNSTTNHHSVTVEPEYQYSAIDYSKFDTLIIDTAEKEAYKIVHYLSQKFLLNKLTIVYITDNTSKESIEKLQTVGIEEFYPTIEMFLSKAA